MVGRRAFLIGGGAAVLGGAAWLGWRQMGSAVDMEAHAEALRQILPSTPETRDLIRYATLAANGHNTQAWKFRAGPTGVDILPDLTRGTPVVYPDHHHLFISPRQNGIVLVIRNAPCGPQLANKHHYALPNETAGLLQGDRGQVPLCQDGIGDRVQVGRAVHQGAIQVKHDAGHGHGTPFANGWRKPVRIVPPSGLPQSGPKAPFRNPGSSGRVQ